LDLRKHLVARGTVSVSDGFAQCEQGVEVKIQRKVSGHWRTVGSDQTSSSGAYKARVPDREGRYRARAPRVEKNAGADVCVSAKSASRRHRH
jgi:hypothetical protein